MTEMCAMSEVADRWEAELANYDLDLELAAIVLAALLDRMPDDLRKDLLTAARVTRASRLSTQAGRYVDSFPGERKPPRVSVTQSQYEDLTILYPGVRDIGGVQLDIFDP